MSLIAPDPDSALAQLAPAEVDRLRKLKGDLPYFSANALRIRAKDGKVIPFKLNRGQLYLHERLERQRVRTGRVRAIVVKGRQMGISTYLQGRFYHKLWRTSASLRAYILTHEIPATENLFGMAKRFHDLFPEDLGKPPTEHSNAKELKFADNECSYAVATAGTKEAGRSATFQLFHGSEVAFWPNADSHTTGAFQAVGDVAGTEIVLESTANGVGNVFHRLAQAAIRGGSEFEAIFIPWFWDTGYELACPEQWDPPDEWYEYAQLHELTWEQLYWGFNKNKTLADSISAPHDKPCWKFLQEYPATFDEAFQTSGNSFIPAADVFKARRPQTQIIGSGPVILGIDPSRSRMGDKCGVIDRVGRRMGQRVCLRMDPGGSVTYLAAQLARIIDKLQPDAVNVDVGGVGAGCYDTLVDMGYGHILNAVNFGSAPVGAGPTGEEMYLNRRAEMHDEMRAWFHGDLPVQIPDDDGLQADLTSAQWGPGQTRYNTNNELILEEKDHIKERLGGVARPRRCCSAHLRGQVRRGDDGPKSAARATAEIPQDGILGETCK